MGGRPGSKALRHEDAHRSAPRTEEVCDCVLIADAGCPCFILNPYYDSCDRSIFSQQGHLSCPGQQRGKGAPVGSCQLCSYLAKIPHQELCPYDEKLQSGGTWAHRFRQTMWLSPAPKTHTFTLKSHNVSPGRDRDHPIQTSHFTNKEPEA